MLSVFSHRSRTVLSLATALVVLGLAGSFEPQALAQTTGPKISKIILAGSTGTTASISFSLSNPGASTAEAQIEYGPTTAYGQTLNSSYASVNNNDILTMGSLTPSSTYHYRLKIRANGATSDSDVSADRTFATRSGSSTGAPIITVSGVDCTDRSCQVTFSTATASNVKIGWDTTLRAPATATALCDPGNYPNCQGESAGSFLATTRRLTMTGLQAQTLYHYRLAATDASGNTSMTGNAASDLTVTTSANSIDHTFSTGNCSEGGRQFPIGSCMPSGASCTTNGPVFDCTSACGYSCSAGQTCNASKACVIDPTPNNSPYQCNQPDCYLNGALKNPAPAGCFGSWTQCTANTILKVQKDRGCNLWLTCSTSLQTTVAKNAPAENLCLSLAACDSLGLEGQCNHYLPQGQCDNDPLRFCSTDKDCEAGGKCNTPTPGNPTRSLRDLTIATPGAISKIADLSGNVITGLDWTEQGGAKVIQGKLPWQLMRQVGGASQLKNGDLEYNPPDISPWITVPIEQKQDDALQVVYEDQSNNVNHVLKVSPVTQITTSVPRCSDASDADKIGTLCTNDSQCKSGSSGTCVATDEPEGVHFSGAASGAFQASPTEYYYAEARLRAENGTPRIRFEFGFDGFRQFSVNQKDASNRNVVISTYTDIDATAAWQRVTIGPIKGMSGETRVAAVCADETNCSEFWLDDVQVKPVLQVNTNPDYVTPSCRLYPKDDAPACDYVDQNGVAYKGWHGYCLEYDSQTGSCLSWWPVDVIKGESNIFGSDKIAGYQDRSPLYYCAEAAGNNRGGTTIVNQSYQVAQNYDTEIPCNYYGIAGSTPQFGLNNYTIGVRPSPASGFGQQCNLAATGVEKGLREDEITVVDWKSDASALDHGNYPDWNFVNSPSFQASSAASPVVTDDVENCEDNDTGATKRVCHKVYREVAGSEIFWRYQNTVCAGQGLHLNCVSGSLVFDATSHELKRYELGVQYADTETATDGYRGAYYQVIFHTKESCDTVVKVVTADGENQAFAQRVNSSTTSVSDLNYKKGTNLRPFGGLLSPRDSADAPTAWGLLTIATQNEEFSTPGQSRGGSPYACDGNCNAAACHVTDATGSTTEGKTCVMSTLSGACGSVDSDTNGLSDAICSGGSAGATSRGTQIFNNTKCDTAANKCQGTGICIPSTAETCSETLSVQSGSKATPALAKADATTQCGINGTTYTKVACDGAGDAACSGGTKAYYNEYAETSVSCTKPQTGTCLTSGNGKICSNDAGRSCTADTDCTKVVSAVPSTCGTASAGCTCVSTGQCHTTGTKAAYTRTGIKSKACSSNADCVFSTSNANDNNYFFAQERLKRLFAQSYGIWRWANGGYQMVSNSNPNQLDDKTVPFVGWTPPSELCPLTTVAAAGVCAKQDVRCQASITMQGQSTDGKDATARTDALNKCKNTVACDGKKAECTNQGVVGTSVKYTGFTAASCAKSSDGKWTCTGRCTVDSNLTYTAATVGTGTGSPITKYVRPTVQPTDYCAIPPKASNIKFLTNSNKTAQISGGSGSIGIQFNSEADPEQVPLQTISIDWGDTQDTYSYPYAPRNDPRQPHIFSHVYAYDRGDTDHCPRADGPCEYHIRIQVKDNWGWCNDAVAGSGADTKCYDDAPSKWVDTGLTVEVQP